MKTILLFITLLSLPQTLLANVTHFEINSDEIYADGKRFGDIGQYRQLSGTIHFSIDPANPRNRFIVDLDQAERNADGLVEASADFAIRAPVNTQNANNVAIIDIPNRGRIRSDRFNLDLDNPANDGFLMNAGYTLLWIGWEEDIDTGIRAQLPHATDSGEPVAGLGFALARDFGSWIRYDDSAPVSADYLMAFGISQSGRFLRNYLYLGFNTDEADRKVYDGVFAHVAGASRIDANRPGADVQNRGQFNATSYPFADGAYVDPVSGHSEGLLENPRASENAPKIFYTNGSNEYWGGGRVAALVHSTPDGTVDIKLPNNVRYYFLAGSEHSPEIFPPGEPENGQLPRNGLSYWYRMRALLVSFTRWIKQDLEPLPSVFPSHAAGTLVHFLDINFPDIPDIHAPLAGLNAGVRVTNPMLSNGAGAGSALPLWVSRVNDDGNEIAGIQAPELLVPLATHTGWNFNNPAVGDPDILFRQIGSYIPFPTTRAERLSSGDPRLSIEERYAGKSDYLEKIRVAAQSLINLGYLLEDDLDNIVEQATVHWDYLMGRP
jgi:hypothetical protein